MPEEIPSSSQGEICRQEATDVLPVHIGIIMDGNGRWARQRGKARTQGHQEGLEAAKRIVKACADIGIKYLTLYAFSTENWRRTRQEVSFLMLLIKKHLKKEYNFYRRNRVRVIHSGDLAGLPADVIAEIESVTADTAGFEGLTANLAINYGGRDEIVRAVNRLLAESTPPQRVTEENIRRHLDHPTLPDPDLIIRTGGETRLSNFLLWELAYAELYFSAKLWPDWDREDLLAAIRAFQGRERRFGEVPGSKD
jgi:undecaprenyl diphosphate synthase